MFLKEEIQIAVTRIQKMEQYLDQVLEVKSKDFNTLCKDITIQQKIQILRAYQESGQWLKDYELDESGALPSDLKRGVLSEDILYDLLCEVE